MLSGGAIDDGTVVLIIENHVNERTMLREICHEAGFAMRNIRDVDFQGKRVTEALQQAIGMVNRGEVDLLLDLALDRADEDPTPAIALIENWKYETPKKTVPLIVVSAFIHLLQQKALESCSAVIRKPGSSESDRTYFTEYLTYAIRNAIISRSKEATVKERIGKVLNWIREFKLDEVTISVFGFKISTRSPIVVGVGFIAFCFLVSGWALLKSGTLSPKVVIGLIAVALIGLLLLGIMLKIVARSRS